MLFESNTDNIWRGIDSLVLPFHPELSNQGRGDAVVNRQDELSQTEAWVGAGDDVGLHHPLETKILQIQQTLDALVTYPPQGWVERILHLALQGALRVRQRRLKTAWKRSVVGRQASVIGPQYEFEPQVMLVTGGGFVMGSAAQENDSLSAGEQPQSVIDLPDYYLARTPITNAQYLVFVEATGHKTPRHWQDDRPPKGKEHHPVVNVSWYDAVSYCEWLAQVTGKPWRLPTEAEWEKAARGIGGRRYPWGDEWDAERCNTIEGGLEDTSPVGAYPQGASPFGLLDMAGNVWEWTSSLYWDYPYQGHDGRENPDSPEARVLRGGSWLNFYDNARATARRYYAPAYHSRIHGFRCCLTLSFSH